ncbi:MAG: DNA-3-methyladenine glycosylase [Bryobacteraceae bacterium]|nr:DNA-3-methyladenine glycosylase [Bryobacteraceae bacterium]MDW8378673.1 DNA-3-methyladenine glycosylase [Bryobacterales bacterium]
MHRAVRHLQAADPTLAKIIATVGPCRIAYRPPTFDTLVRSILAQQLSGKVARIIAERLYALAGEEELSASQLLKIRDDQLRGAGLSEQKITYIKELARHTVEGKVNFESLRQASDETVIETLTKIKGIGVWTAQMFLIFALRRPDVLPISDLGIRKAMQRAYHLTELPRPRQMVELALPWRPYCSVACWYLWRSLSGIAGI